MLLGPGKKPAHSKILHVVTALLVSSLPQKWLLARGLTFRLLTPSWCYQDQSISLLTWMEVQECFPAQPLWQDLPFNEFYRVAKVLISLIRWGLWIRMARPLSYNSTLPHSRMKIFLGHKPPQLSGMHEIECFQPHICFIILHIETTNEKINDVLFNTVYSKHWHMYIQSIQYWCTHLNF